MALIRGTEMPTIDIVLFTITTLGATPKEYALDTANKLAVAIASEVTDPVKLIIKGKLLSQKKGKTTVTGNTLTLTDNVFIAEIVKILQGGTIKYDLVDTTKVIGYTPPDVDADDSARGELFTAKAYSAIYDTSGTVTGYEVITYPNCTGNPIALSSEDGVFRASEYVIDSAPSSGEPPYDIDIVAALPTIS